MAKIEGHFMAKLPPVQAYLFNKDKVISLTIPDKFKLDVKRLNIEQDSLNGNMTDLSAKNGEEIIIRRRYPRNKGNY